MYTKMSVATVCNDGLTRDKTCMSYLAVVYYSCQQNDRYSASQHDKTHLIKYAKHKIFDLPFAASISINEAALDRTSSGVSIVDKTAS